jgi:hypothetical protein
MRNAGDGVISGSKLGPRLQDHIEGRLGGSPNVAEAASTDDLPQFCLASLCSKGRANFLRQRSRHTYHRGGPVVESPDWGQIVFESVACHRLDNQPRAVRFELLAHMRRGAGRITHVVQAIKESDKVEVLTWIVLGRGDFELSIAGDAVLGCVRLRGLDRAWMEVVANELGIRERP